MRKSSNRREQKQFMPIDEILFRAAKEFFIEGRSYDQCVSFWIKQIIPNKSYSKGFFAEAFMEVIRWGRLLAELGEVRFYPKSSRDVATMVNTWLHFAEPKTDSATLVSEKLVAFAKLKELPLPVVQSVPDWLYERGVQELGSDWDAEMAALNTIPQIALRANSLKITTPQLKSRLSEEGTQTREVTGLPLALVLDSRANVFTSGGFQQGYFEVQDLSSQHVAPFLEVGPGMRVIDACAGAGGKSLHIATLMQSKGRLLSMDTVLWKLEQLKKRAVRAGISIIETRTIESSKTVKRLAQTADRLLLDVPCSGTGVFRRNPDARWKLTSAQLDELKGIQADILNRYTAMVKVGGKLVYSTCSIFPSENEMQVEAFLQRCNGQFKLEAEKKIKPSENGSDGFYMARLVRVS
ncbi:MAG TPA: hypothetical protein PLC17_02890 [Tenuifilaceae bacterium]|nr:hypothetical protein [Tenuifilaceae bacterium]HQB76840.1 hypothetical protein [Tenuifilaceae bacterium]